MMQSETPDPPHCTNPEWLHTRAVHTGRAYLCVLCHCRATICPQCDRGQIYCSKACSQKARRSRQREAGRRYQVSDRGRILHAERSRRYREASRGVTHHGLPQEVSPRGSSPASLAIAHVITTLSRAKDIGLPSCYFCGTIVSQFVRLNFMRRYSDGRKARITRKRSAWRGAPP